MYYNKYFDANRNFLMFLNGLKQDLYHSEFFNTVFNKFFFG